jgi:acyl carrier protein
MTMSPSFDQSPAADAASVLDEVRGQVAKELGVDLSQVEPDTVLKQLPGSDSVRLLRVVAQVERVYDVEFEDEDIFRVRTPGELVGLVLAQLPGGE